MSLRISNTRLAGLSAIRIPVEWHTSNFSPFLCPSRLSVFRSHNTWNRHEKREHRIIYREKKISDTSIYLDLLYEHKFINILHRGMETQTRPHLHLHASSRFCDKSPGDWRVNPVGRRIFTSRRGGGGGAVVASILTGPGATRDISRDR